MSSEPLGPLESKIKMADDTKDEDKLYRYNGILYPIIMCPESQLQTLGQFQAREDDILLVAYPKCGFNWMVGVLRKIMTAATGVNMDSKMPPLVEFFGADAKKMMEAAPSPRFLGTHMHPDDIPSSFYEKKTKMLVVFRNPKDTLVSYFHFYNNNPVLPKQEWEKFYPDFMSGDVCWGSYFDHAVAWDKRMEDPNVMIVTYEDLKQDLAKGVRDISAFYGYNLTEAQVQEIAAASTFKAMKESSDSHQIGNIIYRKGEVGDWKNNFTPNQSKEMDDVFKKRLAGTKLGARLKYETHCQ